LVDAVVELVLNMKAVRSGFDPQHLAHRLTVGFPEVAGDFR
jgi:hypothetical protein